jgi:RecB family exonuclease
MQVSHLSPSRIKTFEQCQLKYFAIYEENIEEGPPHPLTIMGSAIHKGAEEATKAILEDKEPLFSVRVKEACLELQVTQENTELASELINNALRWGYERNIKKCCVGVEIPFSEFLPDGTLVKGIIDRLDIMPLREQILANVIDLKTQKREFDDEKLKEEWQSVVYNWATRRIKPEVSGELSMSYWVLRHRVQRAWLTEDDAKRGEEKLMQVAESIRSVTEPEASPSALCPWCPKYDSCPASKENLKNRLKRKIK